MKCNKWEAPILVCHNEERKQKELSKYVPELENNKKELARQESELAEMIGRNESASIIEWKRGQVKHFKGMVKKYEKLVAGLRALTF